MSRISSLPVVDGENLVGIISVRGLVRRFVGQNEATVG